MAGAIRPACRAQSFPICFICDICGLLFVADRASRLGGEFRSRLPLMAILTVIILALLARGVAL